MSLLFYWFASPGWLHLVETLLHSLWQGAGLAVGLFFGLRWVSSPTWRYRLALLALAGLVAASLVTWGVLQAPHGSPAAPDGHAPAMTGVTAAAVVAGGTSSSSTESGGAGDAADPVADPPPMPSVRWSAWLAVVWLLGAAGMLVRAGSQVAGAGRMRREGRPLTEGPVPAMLEQLQRSLGLTRRIRLLVTDRLASPAVAGVLVPVLILPLTLLTALTPEQLRFILLHELAHIRRGDYLVNLFQLLVEALWFFNPAVWWLSRQIRLEREACCDAVAIELSGAPVEYARTLLQVAERYAAFGPAAAPAFGGLREPSSLAERIHRLLTPGRRPRLRLTWRAMIGALLVGGALLALSALGTRITVAAILTPQQRMERIEKLLVESGEAVTPADETSTDTSIAFSGRVRTEDGGTLPKYFWVNQELVAPHNSSHGTEELAKKDGAFKGTCRAGQLTLSVEVPGYAPCVVGPLKMRGTNPVTGLELVMRRGFAVTLQMVDADSGTPLANAQVTVDFSSQTSSSFERRTLMTDSRGNARMTNCANLPATLIGNAEGYEIVQQSFPTLAPDQTLRLTTRRGRETTGQMLDKTTGRPLAGATLQIIRQQGANDYFYDWDYHPLILATSDPDGHWVTTGLRSDARYRLGVKFPGHESVELRGVLAGESNLVIRLGPELIIHGRVTGNVGAAIDLYHRPFINYSFIDPEDNGSSGYQALGRLTNGVIYFEFTNRTAGPVSVQVGGYSETRMVDAPVADWLVELTNPPAPSVKTTPPLRDVVVRLKAASGVAPRGVINLGMITDPNQPHNVNIYTNVPLQNGEARLAAPVGANLGCLPEEKILGYRFAKEFSNWTNIPAGEGPLVLDVPVIPAGIIAATARNADGSPAGGVLFTVQERKLLPWMQGNNNIFGPGDHFSDNAPRQYLTPQLPLGGTYEIIGRRANSFCTSGRIKLTEATPFPVVELKFPPGRDLSGRVLLPGGQPARNATVDGVATVDHLSFGCEAVFTDAQGEFRLAECSPILGHYTLTVSQPGFVAERVKVNFNRLPVIVQLKPAFNLTGRVVEAATGDAIPNASVNAWVMDGDERWPQVTTRTDAGGHFEFNTLGDATYTVTVSGADNDWNHPTTFRAGVVTHLLLKVKPEPGGGLVVSRP